jgi:hypothetical protein
MGGPKTTTNRAGKIKKIKTTTNFNGILAATSSARKYLFVLKESE